MLKKTMTYTDYEGNKRTEDFYFNLNQAEKIKLEFSASGGLSKMIQYFVAKNNQQAMLQLFEDILLKAYGEKSADGKRFVKSKEISEAFAQTEAYSDLFVLLTTDAKELEAFIKGLVPEGESDEPPLLGHLPKQ